MMTTSRPLERLGRLSMVGLVVAVTSSIAMGCGGAPPPAPSPTVQVPTPPSADALPASSAGPVVDKPPSAPPSGGPKVASLPGTEIRFEGGDGHSQDHPVKILGAHGEQDGVRAEYQYLELVYGRGNWTTEDQSLLEVNGKKVDQLDVKHPNAPTEKVYFDISDYFGKF